VPPCLFGAIGAWGQKPRNLRSIFCPQQRHIWYVAVANALGINDPLKHNRLCKPVVVRSAPDCEKNSANWQNAAAPPVFYQRHALALLWAAENREDAFPRPFFRSRERLVVMFSTR
jgi:hypothetical protein